MNGLFENKNNPILTGALCYADNCKHRWNIFLPYGFDSKTGFLECPKCHEMTARLVEFWNPNDD